MEVLKMKKLLLTSATLLFLVFNTCAQENIRKVGTWNMKWLGTNSGNQVDALENVPDYAAYILRTEATLFALQEIGATHSIAGEPKCFYLDKIVEELNKSIPDTSAQWKYILDDRNGQQRLAFLYKKDLWDVSNARVVTPGNSFYHIRRPFIITVKAKGTNTQLQFDFIDIHLKAFDDDASKQKRLDNLEQLSTWLETNNLDDDVLIAGDTNIFFGESDAYQSLEDIHYKYLYDPERTVIYEDALGQRFDRFFCSPGLYNEIASAKNNIGNANHIDVIKDNDPDKIIWFDQNISDHYSVVLNIDVSEER